MKATVSFSMKYSQTFPFIGSCLYHKDNCAHGVSGTPLSPGEINVNVKQFCKHLDYVQW